MNRKELKKLILESCIGPWNPDNNDYNPISVTEAKTRLKEIFKDQENADLDPSERIPQDTAPVAFMEVWNEICVDQIRRKIHCEEVPVESAFIGRSGSVILIQRYGPDDYGAIWYDTYSVRGSLKDIMEEVKEEI